MPDTNKPHYPELTAMQWAWLAAQTDQRLANSLEAADFIADLPQATKDFLRNAEPTTIRFLTRLREDEAKELENAIENTRAIRRVGKLLKWGLVTLFAVFIAFTQVWDKIASWSKIK